MHGGCPLISLQFRPSLIIFVGEAGRRIRELLIPDTLPIYLDQALHQSVLALQVTTEGPHANIDSATPFPIGDVSGDPDTPTQQGPLRDVISRSLRSVQLDRRRSAAIGAGYSVPNPRTQIYIVGEMSGGNAHWMARVLRVVHEEVRRNQLDLPICYFLNCYEPQADHSATLYKPLDVRGLNWSDYEIADFSYIHQHLITYPFQVFLSPDEVRYATAEALLGLVATGVPSIPDFESEIRLPVNLEKYSSRVGSLSTSLVMFPRLAALRYCSTELSAALLQKWYTDLNTANISHNERQQMHDRVADTVRRTAGWIRDSVPRPGIEEHLAPSLAILRQTGTAQSARQIELCRQLDDYSRDLFRAFSYDDVSHEHRRLRGTQTWAAIASKRFGKAAAHYANWERQAKNAWDAASGRVGDEIKQIVDNLWPVSNNGFEMARIYVIGLENRLTRLAEDITRWRQEHGTVYTDQLSQLEREAEDERWSLEPDDPNIQGTEQAAGGQVTPTMGGQGPVIPLNLPTGAQATGMNVADLLHNRRTASSLQRMPGHEGEVALNLGRRASWKQKQVPSIPSLVSFGALTWMTFAFFLWTLPLALVLQIGINVLFVATCTTTSTFLYISRYRDVIHAREDILELYSQYYLHECQRREDLLRIGLLRTLRARIERIRDRLEKWGVFLSQESHNLSQRADSINKELFTGPAGTRDIFIANGERLQSQGRHTLNMIAGHVTQARLHQPLQPWHRTLDDMRTELLRTFRTLPESLLEMREERVIEHINAFTENIIRGYLTGPLVDISLALGKDEIWREVLDRVRKPLYSARAGIRDPQLLLICGSTQDLIRSRAHIPPGAITVQTRSGEWLLAMAFFRGGEPTALNANELFLPKIP
jgi:hypothetical protein